MPIELINNTIKKRSRKKCFITNLTREETNILEKECLETLNKNFECICKKKKKNHFPTFLKIDDNDYIYMTSENLIRDFNIPSAFSQCHL